MAALTVATLLQALEAISRARPDRVLRLRGELPVGAAEPAGQAPGMEPFELLIFRGFSSSVSHATAFDPDQPALPPDARIDQADLLEGPLNPAAAPLHRAPQPVEAFLDPAAWL